MNSTLRFSLRLLAMLALAAGAAGPFLQPRWGNGAFGCLGWSVFWVMLLGIFGYRSMRRGIMAPNSSAMTKIILGGLFLRLVIIIGSHGLLYWRLGGEWGQRALFSTVALYVLALGCEVFTVNQELRAGVLRSEGSRHPTAESTNSTG